MDCIIEHHHNNSLTNSEKHLLAVPGKGECILVMRYSPTGREFELVSLQGHMMLQLLRYQS